jgi:hypothetical protein
MPVCDDDFPEPPPADRDAAENPALLIVAVVQEQVDAADPGRPGSEGLPELAFDPPPQRIMRCEPSELDIDVHRTLLLPGGSPGVSAGP